MPWFLRLLLLAVLSSALSLGCKKIPAGRDAVVKLSLRGAPRKTEDRILSGLATKQSKRFLGVINGFYDWKTLDDSALEADVQRIERELKRAGYYEARVRAVRVIRIAENKVKVEIEVTPGPRITIGKISLEGLSALPFDAAMHGTRAVPLELGEPFDEDKYEQAKLDLANALADVGYAHVKVTGKAQVQLASRSAHVTLTAKPGPRCTLGEVSLEGLEEVPEDIVRQTLMLERGATYSRAKIGDARAALLQLGVFSRVDVVPVLTNPQATEIPVRIKVSEGSLRSVSASAGATLDVVRLGLRGRVAWSHRNFLGGLRKFTVSTRPGLTFFPTRIDALNVAPTNILAENSLTARLEQPAFIGGRTTGFVSTSYNIYPMLYPLSASPVYDENGDPLLDENGEVIQKIQGEKETVLGYNEIALSTGLEHPYLHGRLPISLSMNWRANFPFYYQGDPYIFTDPEGNQRGLDPVVVTYPELDVVYDLRDDPINPSKGIVLSSNLQVAVPLLASEILDWRIQPEVRTYVPLDFKKRLVLAARYTMGFLLTDDYGSALTADNPLAVQDQHTLLFRGFYSGGPNSNRGYPYRAVGPYATIGFLVPSETDCQTADAMGKIPANCLKPLGGFNLWEASLELRYRFAGPWGLVTFADMSDVGLQGQVFDFSEPHLSVGLGLRYASPVGPIRVDVGYRVPGMQSFRVTPPGEPPDVSEVEPYASERWGGAAVHIVIGEAF